MQISTTYLSVIVMLVGEFLKWTGVEVGSEAITTTLITLIQFGAAIKILIERFKKGGVSIFGTKIH